MTFPQTQAPVLVEIAPGGDPNDPTTWAWVDVTGYVRQADRIRISGGRRDEGNQVDTTTCQLTLDNRDGRFSPRNPEGAYYPDLTRGTPLRVSMKHGATYLKLDALNNAIECPDTDDLSITGDIDIRVDADLVTWAPETAWNLIGKGGEGGDSWVLSIWEGGTLILYWWTDASTWTFAESTVTLPYPLSGRKRVRATLDVDNGAGGHTVVFYTGDTLDGPWEQLGDAVVGSGTTQINDGSSPLRINPASDNSIYYEVRVYDGIDGTLVAAPDFTAQTDGATSFTDDQGNEWSLTGGEITNRRTRFVGTVVEWPARWDITGNNAYTPITATGIMRRMQQGRKGQTSMLRRRISKHENLVAYWPLEDGPGTRRAGSTVPGVESMEVRGFSFGVNDDLPSSRPLPTITVGGSLVADVPTWPNPTAWHIEFVLKIDEPDNDTRIISWRAAGGTIYRWRILLEAGASALRLQGYTADGTLTVNEAITPTQFASGDWIRLAVLAEQDGSDVDWKIRWFPIGSDGFSSTGTVSSATVGSIHRVQLRNRADTEAEFAIGHIAVFSAADVDAFQGADASYTGEYAIRRMNRVAEEEGLLFSDGGWPGSVTATLGPQAPGSVLDVFRDAENADGGMLIERDSGIAYIPRIERYNQPVWLELDAGDGGLADAPEPADDDQQLRNDITARRADGGSARAVNSSSIASDGRYDEEINVNVADDTQLPDIAGWRLHLGTADEMRWPRLTLDLARNPDLIPTWLEFRPGARLRVSHEITQLPGVDIDVLAEGWTETIGPYEWRAELNCVPARPWTVGVLESPQEAAEFVDDSVAVVNTDSITVTLPDGWEPGQLAILIAAVNDDGETVTGPAGWTVLDSGPVETGSMEAGVWWRILEEGDSDPTVTVSATQKIAAAVVTYSGCDPYLPIAAVGARGTRSSSSGVTTAGSVTTTRPHQRVVGFFAEKSSTATTAFIPATMEPRAFTFGSGGGAVSAIILDEVAEDAGATGVRTVLYDTSSGAGYGLLVALRSPEPEIPDRIDTAGSELAGDVDADDTSWTVLTTQGPPWTTDEAEMPIPLRAGGEVVHVTAVESPFVDTFDRTESGGWGTTDTGQAWTATNGTDSDDFSVSGGLGIVSMADKGTRYFTMAGSYADVVLTSSISVDAVAATVDFQTGLIARAADTDTHYLCHVVWTTGNRISLALYKRVSGTYTELEDAGAVLRYVADDTIRAKFSVIGGALKAKVWVDGSSEPPEWQVTATDTSITAAGAVGTHSSLLLASGNDTPVTVSYGPITVVSPQTMTVVRSRNGVSKAHSAGTDVRLAHPFILSY